MYAKSRIVHSNLWDVCLPLAPCRSSKRQCREAESVGRHIEAEEGEGQMSDGNPSASWSHRSTPRARLILDGAGEQQEKNATKGGRDPLGGPMTRGIGPHSSASDERIAAVGDRLCHHFVPFQGHRFTRES